MAEKAKTKCMILENDVEYKNTQMLCTVPTEIPEQTPNYSLETSDILVYSRCNV